MDRSPGRIFNVLKLEGCYTLLYLCLQSVHNVRPIGQYFGLLPDPKQSMQTKLKSIFSISPEPLQAGHKEAICLKATVSNNPFSLLPVGVP